MGNSESYQEEIKKMWMEEEKLTLKERRSRYLVKDKFLIIRPENDHWGLDKTILTSALQGVGRLVYKSKHQKGPKKIPKFDPVELVQWKPSIPALKQNFWDTKKLSMKIATMQIDITSLEIDAIVNAANTSLRGGGGIDGAIHKAAGKKLLKECKLVSDTFYRGTKTGTSKITRGYNLPAKFVIHTVAPKNNDQMVLHQCYNSVLSLVSQHKIKTVGFCAIGTGIYGFHPVHAAHIAIRTVSEWLSIPENYDSVDLILFTTYTSKETTIYQALLSYYFPYIVSRKKLLEKLQYAENYYIPLLEKSGKEGKEEEEEEKKEEIQEDSSNDSDLKNPFENFFGSDPKNEEKKEVSLNSSHSSLFSSHSDSDSSFLDSNENNNENNNEKIDSSDFDSDSKLNLKPKLNSKNQLNQNENSDSKTDSISSSTSTSDPSDDASSFSK